MELRFYIDPDTALAHIECHGVAVWEVRDVLRKPLEEIKGRRGSIIALGQTQRRALTRRLRRRPR